MSFFKTYFLHFICNIFAFCAQHYKDKYDLVCSQYEKNYKYLHDLIHTCSDLTRLVNTQNYSQLKEDISSLANKASGTFNLLCSNSIPLNMVLNVYRNQFQDFIKRIE